jgi:hypothetical protein
MKDVAVQPSRHAHDERRMIEIDDRTVVDDLGDRLVVKLIPVLDVRLGLSGQQ